MKNIILILCAILLVFVCSCNTGGKKNTDTSDEMGVATQKGNAQSKTTTMDKADSLVTKTIAAHGGELYDTAHYEFKFRKNRYTFHNKKEGYIYSTTSQKDGNEIRDVLENGTFSRTINGKNTELSEKDITKYTEALNSVIYFATLPYKLQDAAVNKSFEGRTTIKNQEYDILLVSFDEAGGGTDHDDTFMYWLNSKTGTIDYLAYSYATNDGGVRFRSAYDPRTIAGIRFQNYINYEAPLGTPLKKLPELYEMDELKELSRIETVDVVALDK
ncbi:hypothetical protein LCGC14_1150270 [marine sediment metagenome]|uniref:Deoxyribose-phosphate aldolase n=2 Tax=root TaxID=1 RepID=A0A831VMU8_9FLAO|nr:hypothetical protein [Pricia sp.]HEA21060.1 hypothetical protein [Pricia antarctica]